MVGDAECGPLAAEASGWGLAPRRAIERGTPERQDEMGRWDAQIEKQRATIQAEVPEPCLAIGQLQPAGTWGSFGLEKIIPGAGMFKQHKSNQGTGPLSARKGMKMNHITYLALTADKVYAFDVQVKGRGLVVRDKLAEWNRSDVTVTLVPGKLATRVVIDHTDGAHSELEATTMGGYQDDFLAALGALSKS